MSARARFIPQAWVNDYAMTVDAPGPDTFEVPDECVGLTGYEADALREHDNAPAWMRDWSGPFEIVVSK